jgi:hypothetical protein
VGCKVPRVMKLGERDEAVGWGCRLDGAPVSPLQGGRSERGRAVQKLKGVGVCRDGGDWCCLVLVEREGEGEGKGMRNEGTREEGRRDWGPFGRKAGGQVRFLGSREGARAVILHAPCLAGASRVHLLRLYTCSMAEAHQPPAFDDKSRHNMKTRHGHMFTLAVSVS